jgi:RNA polymerase sigma factor (sigma-70 family)
MSEQHDLRDLLEAAANGEKWAGEALVRRFERLVWSVVRTFHLDYSTGWDVFNTVFLRLWEHCGRIREPAALPGWLVTTTRNEAMRTIRSQTRVIPTDFEYDVPDKGISFEERLVEDEEMASVVAAYSQLEERCQTLLRLLSVEPKLDYETIASLMGKTMGYLGPTRKRCIDKLKRIMERRRKDEDGDAEVGRVR